MSTSPFPATLESVVHEIAAILKHYRERHGITSEELARRAKVTRSMVSRIEREEKAPSLAILLKLADCLEVPISELVKPPSST